MLRMRTKLTGLSPMTGFNSPPVNGGAVGGDSVCGEGAVENWEVRPSGMLVQKRLDTDQHDIKLVPIIRVRVKYGSSSHEIHISSIASFGELKKMLAGPTGLHHEDQKLYYKGKERDSKQFLDTIGVKDKSKLVLVEDPISQEKRYLELRRTAKMEKASKAISEISLQVDKLGVQVAAIESVILKGGRVAEKEVVNLIELLMNELIKLDGIIADGDVKLQRKMQVRRVQKYVELLDVLKVKNSHGVSNGQAKSSVYTGNNQDKSSSIVGKPPLAPKHQPPRQSLGPSPLQPQQPPQQQSGTVVTTQWETFESTPPLIPVSSTGSTPSKVEKPKFPWDFFE